MITFVMYAIAYKLVLAESEIKVDCECSRLHRSWESCAILWISDATIYVGGLDEKVSDPILWELFLQAGPVSE